MNTTINQRNWQTFFDIRRELGLDKIPEPDLEEKVISGTGNGRGMPGVCKPRRSMKPIVYRKKPSPQRPGEITFKQWVMMKAEEFGITLESAYDRFYHGRLKCPNKRVVNSRVIFVKI